MRLQIEAGPDEVPQKREALLRALSDAIRPHDPELAERFSKATTSPAGRLRHLSMRQLQQALSEGYKQSMDEAMLRVGKVLSKARFEVRKASPVAPLRLRKGG